MNKEIAEKTALAMQMASSIVDNHLRNLQMVLDKEESREWAKKSGKIMSEIYLEVLRPLWVEYPDLLPEGMDGSYVVDEQMYRDIQKILDKYAAIKS